MPLKYNYVNYSLSPDEQVVWDGAIQYFSKDEISNVIDLLRNYLLAQYQAFDEYFSLVLCLNLISEEV